MSTIQRITGTNSGLDVDSLVKSSMKVYQTKIDKETQKEKVLEYQQEQYKQIMSDATDFYAKYFDVAKSDSLFKTATYQSVGFTSKDDTKVTAKGFAGADVSDYKVTTTQIAQKATATFYAGDLKGTNLSVKVADKDAVSVALVQADGVIDMKATAQNLTKALNEAGVNVTAKYSEFSQSIVLESGAMGASVNFQAGVDDANEIYRGKNAQGTITKGNEVYNFNQDSNVMTIDNVQFTIKAPSASTTTTETLSDLEELPGVGIGESVSQTSADGAKITTSKSADGITTTTKKVNTDGTIIQTVSDGIAKVTTKFNTDGTVIEQVTEGSTITFQKSYSSVSLTGSYDVKDLKDKIVSFVKDYNTLLQSINTKLYETRDKDYMPLTDEQKKDMSETEITAWEKKAQTGLLKSDSDLERIASAMKSAMATVMSGSGLRLEEIGIKPVDNYAEKNGTFDTPDEDALTKALQDNAANIKDLFTRSASTTDKNDKGGIITQLESIFKSEFKNSDSSLSKKAGLDGTSTQYNNTLTENIKEKKTLIAELNKKYSTKEDALYKKYSNLETAMEKLNAQKSSLASMLGQSS